MLFLLHMAFVMGERKPWSSILIQTTPSGCRPRKRLLLLTLPSADKLMRQQFRTCPIWDRALGPLQMNSFPCERKKCSPSPPPPGFHLSQPTGPRQYPSPWGRWRLFLVSSHGVRAPTADTPTKSRAQQSGMVHLKHIYLCPYIDPYKTIRVKLQHLFWSSSGD